VTLAIASWHKIGDEPGPEAWGSWYYVPEATFVEQLQQCAARGWTVVGIDEVRAAIDNGSEAPDRALLLTFDDAYRSFRTTALPWLRRFGYPAVVFAPTDHVGATNIWDHDDEPPEALADWDDLLDLQAQGVSVQSHGASHRAFSDLSPQERADELRRSREALEDKLGQAVDMIAYPYGDDAGLPDDLRMALLDTGYRAGCLYGGGPNATPVADPFRLSRLALGPDSDIAALLAPPT